MSIVLWAGGLVLLVLAIWQVRAPLARLRELDRLAENAQRYESWRGGRSSAAGNETTGADVMRDMLRRRVYTWAGLAIVGVILVFAGFAIR